MFTNSNLKKFFWIFIISVSFLSAFFLYKQKDIKPIHSDGVGYYAYLPAIAYYDGLSFKNLISETSKQSSYFSEQLENPEGWFGFLENEETGRFLNKYPIGSAILMVPFFILGHFLSLVFNEPRTGFTFYYQVAIGLSGVFYMISGLFILKKFLVQYFSEKIAYLTLLSIFLGTNLIHYGVNQTAYSHIYSFFLFSLFLYFTPNWHKKPSLKNSLIIGLLTGLIFITRNTNIIFVLVFIFFNVSNLKSLKAKVIFFKNHFRYLLIIAGTAFIAAIPQFLYWHYVTGKFFIRSYSSEEYFDFLHPKLLQVLFSNDKGLFFYTPLLLLSLFGLFLMRKKLKELVLGSVLYLLLNLFLIASWWKWTFGAGRSHRGFTESLPIFAIFLASLYSVENKKLRIIIYVLSALTILFSALYIFFSWESSISIRELFSFLNIF